MKKTLKKDKISPEEQKLRDKLANETFMDLLEQMGWKELIFGTPKGLEIKVEDIMLLKEPAKKVKKKKK